MGICQVVIMLSGYHVFKSGQNAAAAEAFALAKGMVDRLEDRKGTKLKLNCYTVNTARLTQMRFRMGRRRSGSCFLTGSRLYLTFGGFEGRDTRRFGQEVRTETLNIQTHQ